jgi:hypothetical protein
MDSPLFGQCLDHPLDYTPANTATSNFPTPLMMPGNRGQSFAAGFRSACECRGLACPLRLVYSVAINHVRNRGRRASRYFSMRRTFAWFVQLPGDGHARWRMEALASCVMGNPSHLCSRPPEGNLARAMKWWGSPTGGHVLRHPALGCDTSGHS